MILQRLADFGELGPSQHYPTSLWEELSVQLNRPPEIVRARVRTIRQKNSGGVDGSASIEM